MQHRSLSFLAGLAVLFTLHSQAQIVFRSTDLPSQPGVYHRAYYSTSAVDVSTLLGQTGGPWRWDFSFARTATESVQRMDVVATSDGGQAASFPIAAYAERLANETTGAGSWSYYRIATNQGRLYFGFYDAVANPTCPLKIFDAPTIDLPDNIHFGQSWSRTVDFGDCVDAGFIVLDLAVHFTSQAQVDAYGTVVLPGLGELPALRVNEVNSYHVTDLTLGLLNSTQHFRNYYWLVRGIGKAVHIISPGSTTVPPPNFPTAGTVRRVFEARPWPAANLRIHRQDAQVLLTWREEADTSGYRVESRPDLLPDTMWQVVAEPTSNSWTEPMMTGELHHFFRVIVKP